MAMLALGLVLASLVRTLRVEPPGVFRLHLEWGGNSGLYSLELRAGISADFSLRRSFPESPGRTRFMRYLLEAFVHERLGSSTGLALASDLCMIRDWMDSDLLLIRAMPLCIPILDSTYVQGLGPAVYLATIATRMLRSSIAISAYVSGFESYPEA